MNIWKFIGFCNHDNKLDVLISKNLPEYFDILILAIDEKNNSMRDKNHRSKSKFVNIDHDRKIKQE